MSTLLHWNETKTADLRGTHAVHGKCLVIFMLKDGTVDHVLCGCYGIVFLIEGEGPHLLAIGR